MKKYRMSCQITVSAYCEVEAENEAQAIEKSMELQPAFHPYNTGTSPEENWCIEEPDGEPMKIEVSGEA